MSVAVDTALKSGIAQPQAAGAAQEADANRFQNGLEMMVKV